MTADDYFAYCLEYQQRLASALLLARMGLADPSPEEVEEMEAFYEDEDPFEEQAVVLQLDGEEVPLALFDQREDAELACDEDLFALERLLSLSASTRNKRGTYGSDHSETETTTKKEKEFSHG